MKRYRVGVKCAGDGTSFVGAAIEFERGEYVLHSDHEAALKAAVAARDDQWASAIAKYAPFNICKKIADEMNARGAAHD